VFVLDGSELERFACAKGVCGSAGRAKGREEWTRDEEQEDERVFILSWLPMEALIAAPTVHSHQRSLGLTDPREANEGLVFTST
jgi:hypothetical protein